MDIPCPFCREPWDMDCIHEEIKERSWPKNIAPALDKGLRHDYEKQYEEVKKDFILRGCVALGGHDCRDENPEKNSFLAVAYSELGFDLDGLAVELEDWEAMGNTF